MVAASAVIRPTFGAPSGMSYWFAKGRAQSIIRLLTETFFVLIVTAVRADGNGRMSEEGLQHYAYELFAKELLDSKNTLLCEFIRKEEERLSKIYDSLCVQEESDKCRARKETVEKELAIHRWALSQFGVE